jgi:hypothetical protein
MKVRAGMLVPDCHRDHGLDTLRKFFQNADLRGKYEDIHGYRGARGRVSCAS